MRRSFMFIIVQLFVILISFILAGAVEIRNVTFNTKNAGKVEFSHHDHIKQKGISNNCNTCHDSIYDFRKKVRYTMADMEKGKSCGACHNGIRAFELKSCVRCHQVKEITYSVKATGATYFSHKKHLVPTPDCNTCHPALFNTGPNKHVKMSEMYQGKSCGACHDSKQAFSIRNCSVCHPTKDPKFIIQEVGNVLFKHTSHTGHYNCDKCHPKLFPTRRSNSAISMKAMEQGKSCGACHNGKAAFTVAENCDTCHKAK